MTDSPATPVAAEHNRVPYNTVLTRFQRRTDFRFGGKRSQIRSSWRILRFTYSVHAFPVLFITQLRVANRWPWYASPIRADLRRKAGRGATPRRRGGSDEDVQRNGLMAA